MSPPIDLRRRSFLLAGGCLALTGCGISPTLDLMADSAKKIFSNKSPPRVVTRELVEAIPYSTLGVRVGSHPWVLMVLAKVRDGQLEWVSHDGVIFLTLNGVIVQTRGMQRDLSSTRWVNDQMQAPFASQSASAGGEQLSRTLSFIPNTEGWVPATSRITALGTEDVELFGEKTPLAAYRESLDFPTWRWKADNYYWVDQEAGVRKSIQQYCPEIPPITLEFFPRFSPART